MPLPIRDFAQQVLIENGRAGLFHKAIHRAWNTTVERYPERALWRRKSTFRGLMWEEAVKELATLTTADPDFKFIEHCDTVSFILEDAFLFRIKHADMTLSTANYPTSEAGSFDNHDVDLYGFSGLQRVELCYVLNEFETDIVWVGVSARANGHHLWKIELTNAGILAPVAELPLEPDIDTAKLAKIRKVQPEQETKKRKDRGNS